MKVPKLKRMPLKEQAYRALREMITAMRFSPETRINVEELSKELGVSRTPVWQALQRLEEEGMVRHVPNRGVVMVGMSPEAAADLYLVRGHLEGLAASLAAPSLSQEEIDELRRILDEQEGIVAASDLKAYSKSDYHFHAVIYAASGNWMLKELLGNIKMRTRPLSKDITPILGGLYQDHLATLAALEEHDPDAARRAMTAHNQRMRDLMLTQAALGVTYSQQDEG